MGLNSVRFLKRYGSAKMWAAFLLWDLLALPFALIAGILWGRGRSARAKVTGIWDGLRGRPAGADALERWGAPRPGTATERREGQPMRILMVVHLYQSPPPEGGGELHPLAGVRAPPTRA